MSRLMFEGDTTDRFGRLFPKPFIQQIRVFDDLIESDVVLFFELPLDETETEELIATLNENLRVYGVFLDQFQFNRTIDPSSTEEFYKNSFFTLYQNENDFRRIEPLQNLEYIYNSEGKKFAKALVTFSYVGWSSSGFGTTSTNKYFACFTSFESPRSILAEENASWVSSADSELNALSYYNTNNLQHRSNLYKSQTSDLVYENVIRANGQLNVGRQVVYREMNGIAYNKTPIQSLSRVYKKSNQVTHQRILDFINPILTPFIGSVSEADMVSTTLSTYSNDPSLLVQLEKDINSFSNKSSTTTTGRLYSELVNGVTDIDNLLQTEETVNKRIEINNIVVDRRGDLVLIGESVDASNTENLEEQGYENTGDAYIYPFLFDVTEEFYYDSTGNLTAKEIYDAAELDPTSIDLSVYKTSGFIFFDYEKALNYRSNISIFFNIYNLEQIFGKNCLNSYYKIATYNLKKKYVEFQDREIGPDDRIWGTYDNVLEMEINGPYGDCEVQTKTELPSGQLFQVARSEVEPIGSGNNFGNEYKLVKEYTYMRVLPFEQFRNGQNYKLIALELVDFNVLDLMGTNLYQLEISFDDTTWQFYDTFIRQTIFDAYDKLQEYFDLASEFCSYNNLDGRFNDFFVNYIQNEFEQPYPWEQSALVYHSMTALLDTSYDSIESTADYTRSNRRKDGSFIDMEKLQNQAILESKQINPSTGDLEGIQNLLERFESLKEIFELRRGLDQGSTIYDPNEEDYVLRRPTTQDVLTRKEVQIQYNQIENYNISMQQEI